MPTRFVRRTALLLATVALSACSERTTVLGPTHPLATTFDAAPASTPSTQPTTSVRWNEIARTLVASHNTNGPMASRVYALVSMAQFTAVASVDDADRAHGPSAAGGVKHPSEQAAIARASADVLSKLYTDPATTTLLAAKLADDEAAPTGPQAKHTDVSAGDAIGATVAEQVNAHAAADGASAANCPATPPLPASQFWHDDAIPPNPQPLLPCFGNVRPWLDIESGNFEPARRPHSVRRNSSPDSRR